VCAATCAWAQDAPAPAPASAPAPAPDTRTQYPAFMTNSYFSFTVGSIGYLFTNTQLEPGFQAGSIDKPRLAVRADFFGHYFTKNVSAQVTYMRPARFVSYNDINGKTGSNQVSNAYAGLTFVYDHTLNENASIYGEAGWGVTSRSGFQIDGRTVLQPAHYAAGLIGGGLAFHATANTDFMFGATYSPGRKSFEQPSTRLFTAGLRYHMRPLPSVEVAENREAGFLFPENVIRIGASTNVVGYGLNDLFSKKIPIFWGGHVETKAGLTIDYQRNVFHTKKIFAFDLGASASTWSSNIAGESFNTLSAYPLFRFFMARIEPADIYFCYSLAGPTLINRTTIDGLDTGARFTFQDFMGIGAYLRKDRRLNAEIGIKHFSNGNLFVTNASIKVPVTLTLGLTF
jgi:opacity protein-like surface antigen